MNKSDELLFMFPLRSLLSKQFFQIILKNIVAIGAHPIFIILFCTHDLATNPELKFPFPSNQSILLELYFTSSHMAPLY